MTGTGTAGTSAVLTATLGVGAVAWVVSVQQMQGMDMGVATDLSFQFFVAAWLAMMPPGCRRGAPGGRPPRKRR